MWDQQEWNKQEEGLLSETDGALKKKGYFGLLSGLASRARMKTTLPFPWPAG